MMRWNTFARSLGFAAIGAAGSAAWLLCAGPLLGWRLALAVYLVGATAAYAGGLADSLRRRTGAAFATAVAGGVLLLLLPGLRELCIGLAVLLALVRSGFLQPTAPARAALAEAGLVLGGLLFAAALAGPSLRATMLAVWGFFLVQSLFFLVPGARRAGVAETRRDPFDAAHARAAALLDRGFV